MKSVRLPQSGRVFISVKDSDKAKAVEIARELHEAGFLLVATRGGRLEVRTLAGDRAESMLVADLSLLEPEPTPPPLIRGDVLAEALGIQPGPALGPLLAQIAEEQAAGTVTTADEAIAFARSAQHEA